MLEETFRSGEKFPSPGLERTEVQYLYSDDLYHFLDQESFEQVSFTEEQIADVKNYLKEDTIYSVLKFRSEPIAVEPPMFMELCVTETVPGIKGNE